MHYNATLCVAYAAGFSEFAAQQIATSCQFVDDNHGAHIFTGSKVDLEFKDGARIYLTPTAHHFFRAGAGAISNVTEEFESSIWVPFHFIPGNEGDSFEERMLTTKDSEISKKVVVHAQEKGRKPYALQLLGITAHCYTDSFSHYGFSGVKSELNNVKFESIDFSIVDKDMEKHIAEKTEDFLVNYMDEADDMGSRFITALANKAKIGHGAALTHPDMPFLDWRFNYDLPRSACTEENDRVLGVRNNPATFLEACEALHRVFVEFLEIREDYKGEHDPVSFEAFESIAKKIIVTEGKKPERCKLWENAFDEGHFGKGSGLFPLYLGHDWNLNVEQADGQDTADEFLNLDVFKFYQAAEQHRAFVLRDLLPNYGLIVK